MGAFAFEPVHAAREASRKLRSAVVATSCSEELGDLAAERRANTWSVFDAAFSRKLAARGWIGTDLARRVRRRRAQRARALRPARRAAGRGRTRRRALDRRPPKRPTPLRYGTEAQRHAPSPRHRARRVLLLHRHEQSRTPAPISRRCAPRGVEERATGWRISGQKVWTTHAHQAHMMIALVRTGGDGQQKRHEGLTQFLIDLKARRHHGAADRRPRRRSALQRSLPRRRPPRRDDGVLGVEGQGWAQCTSELSLERSGPERYLSSHALFVELLRWHCARAGSVSGRAVPDRRPHGRRALDVAPDVAVGRRAARGRAATRRSRPPSSGSRQRLRAGPAAPRQAVADAGLALEDATPLARALALLLQTSPSFSLRGGTREILRGIIARGLGLAMNSTSARATGDVGRHLSTRLLRDSATTAGGCLRRLERRALAPARRDGRAASARRRIGGRHRRRLGRRAGGRARHGCPCAVGLPVVRSDAGAPARCAAGRRASCPTVSVGLAPTAVGALEPPTMAAWQIHRHAALGALGSASRPIWSRWSSMTGSAR